MSQVLVDMEYQLVLFGRHLAAVSGRQTRRRSGLLDQSGYVLLSFLKSSGPLSISELRDVLGLDVSTLNRQLAALRKAGHVERAPDPAGGIALKFHLTAGGEAALAEEQRVAYEKLELMISDWPERKRRVFARLLSEFNRSIETMIASHQGKDR